MKKSFTDKQNIRKSFGKIPDLVNMPNLLEIQKNSYDLFLQKDIKPEEREDIGLQAVFNKVFPITDFSGVAELRFVRYELEDPKYDVEECIQRGGTYGSLLKVTLNLIIREIDEETGISSVKDIKEQDVYLGDMPLMTSKGTFVFNGTTRVVVSQMHRSPGVFFDHDKGKSHSSGKFLFASRLIPYNGSWIDFEFDPKDLLYVRIDKRRKLLASSLLLALDNKKSSEYRENCKKDGKEIDYNKIKFDSNEKKLIGDTTHSGIESGVVNGLVEEIKGIIDNYQNLYPKTNVILTGGDTAFIKSIVSIKKNSIFAQENLTLIGLNSILNYNA